MIVRITGTLAEVRDESVVVDRDGMAYEVLVCGYARAELLAHQGQQVTLHTMQYYEASAAGGNLTPRIVGFLHAEDRAFFEQIIKVKGLGVRKAVKALNQPTGKIASAIEAGNDKFLASLPGIGKRAAAQIVAELKGKLAEFAFGETEAGEPTPPAATELSTDQRDALEVIVALGERRADAEQWLQRAAQLHPDTRGADEWVRLVYRIRSGSEG
jgi:Holliday junction DNA helicase RuvA